MKVIELTRGYRAVVDDVDFVRLCGQKWYASVCGRNVYACRDVTVGNRKRRKLFLHYAVLGIEQLVKGYVVDHINHDPLDCRKVNLRVCTIAQNRWNSRANRKQKWSRYKGVSYHRSRGEDKPKWQAKIGYKGHRVHLGFYEEEYEAVVMYNRASCRLYGEYGYVNRWGGPSGKEGGKEQHRGSPSPRGLGGQVDTKDETCEKKPGQM